MNSFTIEEKVAAFDELWNRFGNHKLEFYDYVKKIDSTSYTEISHSHMPRKVFKIFVTGNHFHTFKDILNELVISGGKDCLK